MTWRPFNTLAGRMVLVTLCAVVVSYAIALFLYSNERGAALRRAAETAVIERVAYTAERLREIPASQRARAAGEIRDFSIQYSAAATPEIIAADQSGAGARVARAISTRLDNIDVRGFSRDVDRPSRRWRGRGGPGEGPDLDPHRNHSRNSDPGPLIRTTEISLSVALAPNSWLNAKAYLPGPRPLPLSTLIGGLVSLVIVGIGAVLVSRQIARPLGDLATAARALGAGETNVTAPVSGPDDVRRASVAFNAMAERLGRQLNRQRQMLWALSHDLRTPITALRLRAELIEDETVRARLMPALEEIERLTEQALSLARAGASEEARVNVDLAEIARTLCGELQDMGVNATADAPHPVMAACRPDEIARALRNLAENAAKYGGAGVMHVYRNAGGEAVVDVTDDGPGVPEDQIAKLTAPFFRADEARSQANGAGLGLAITQAIADGHGGRLELSNRSPRGFSAKLVLPG